MVSILLEFHVLQNHDGRCAVVFKPLVGKSFFSFRCKTKLRLRNLVWCKWIWQVMGPAVTIRLQ